MKVQILSDTLKSAECCIYCGARDDLTVEHIIPFGLWGRIEYPDASCKRCAKEINVFERQVQQKHLGAFRQRTKIPLRKRRPRKYKFALSFGTTDPKRPAPDPIEIGGDEMPRSILLLRFMPAKIFIDSWPNEAAIWMHQNDQDMQDLMDKHQNPAVFMGEYDNNMFCRLIAKIGHGLTLAYFDPEVLKTFQFLLPELILEGTEDYHRLIGGDFHCAAAKRFDARMEYLKCCSGRH
ncbi:MAG: hypothetical protein V3V55_00330 [Rhodospirillales bacterium]